MKALHLPALSALLILTTSALASPLPPGGNRSPPLHHPHGGGRHGIPFVFFVEREPTVIIEREVVREVAVTPPPAPPHQGEGKEETREPWVLGRTYASLPGGCMKLIEGGAAYFLCSGLWYRQLGARAYKAVARP